MHAWSADLKRRQPRRSIQKSPIITQIQESTYRRGTLRNLQNSSWHFTYSARSPKGESVELTESHSADRHHLCLQHFQVMLRVLVQRNCRLNHVQTVDHVRRHVNRVQTTCRHRTHLHQRIKKTRQDLETRTRGLMAKGQRNCAEQNSK